jgi:hypothetical protein
VFTWLDGALILAYIGAVAAVLGGAVLAGLTFAARIAKIDWRALSLSLIPLAGIGLFLGLSMMTATHLRAEGAPLGWLPVARGALLAVGLLWSGWLGMRLLFDHAEMLRAMRHWPCPSSPCRWPPSARPGYLVFYAW